MQPKITVNNVRNELIHRAKEDLRSLHIKGVCTDALEGLTAEEMINRFDQLVSQLVDDTLYWEDYDEYHYNRG